MTNPVGFLGTVYAQPWSYEKRFSMAGDAAHAITPFFGQGCNSGFEDVSVLHEILTAHRRSQARINGYADDSEVPTGSLDMHNILKEYYNSRKPNTDAIANMALENFEEMMSKTADKRFLLEKDIELKLADLYPEIYVSRYALITHSLLPYRLCQGVGMIQNEILNQLSHEKDSIEQVDFNLADELIQNKLVPYLNENAINPEKCHYQSHYYEPKDNNDNNDAAAAEN
jgi:kynurenine 3-monooxygenase